MHGEGQKSKICAPAIAHPVSLLMRRSLPFTRAALLETTHVSWCSKQRPPVRSRKQESDHKKRFCIYYLPPKNAPKRLAPLC